MKPSLLLLVLIALMTFTSSLWATCCCFNSHHSFEVLSSDHTLEAYISRIASFDDRKVVWQSSCKIKIANTQELNKRAHLASQTSFLSAVSAVFEAYNKKGEDFAQAHYYNEGKVSPLIFRNPFIYRLKTRE